MPTITEGDDVAYGYVNSVALANDVTLSTVAGDSGGADIALGNADSYALLGAALLTNSWDWRDGFARTSTFWLGKTPNFPLAAAPAPAISS